MTETQAAITLYRDILLCIALVVFTTNQLSVLFREVSLDITLKRVRRLASLRSQQRVSDPGNTSEDMVSFAPEKPKWKAKPRQDTRKWNASKIPLPKIHFNWLAVAGGLGLLLVFGLAYYIFGIYDPSGGR